MGGRQPDLTLTRGRARGAAAGGGRLGAAAAAAPAARRGSPRPRRRRMRAFVADLGDGARSGCSGLSDARSGLRPAACARLGLPARELGAVERQEVDLLEVQRRVAAVAGDVADDAAQVGEDQPRALDHQQRMQLLRRHVLDQEQPGVVELEDEDRRLGRPCESTLSFSATS